MSNPEAMTIGPDIDTPGPVKDRVFTIDGAVNALAEATESDI